MIFVFNFEQPLSLNITSPTENELILLAIPTSIYFFNGNLLPLNLIKFPESLGTEKVPKKNGKE